MPFNFFSIILQVIGSLVPDPLNHEALVVENIPDPLAGEQVDNEILPLSLFIFFLSFCMLQSLLNTFYLCFCKLCFCKSRVNLFLLMIGYGIFPCY